MPPSSPELMDEMVEEVLLHFPPREPACLARAALVCKRWRRLVSDPGFRRRFDELHPRPKMLGFLCNNLYNAHIEPVARFVPTAISSSCSPLAAYEHHGWRAEDARHGRVLLSRHTRVHVLFMVWDPITGQRQELPAMPRTTHRWMSAMIHCAAIGTCNCNHLDCRSGGPFRVVYMGSRTGGEFTCTYSSEAAAWSKPVPAYIPTDCGIDTLAQSVLVGKALYFKFNKGTLAIGYDCELCKVEYVIPLPQQSMGRSANMLITTEDGGLGCAALFGYNLYLWSRKADYKVDNGWLQGRVIDLERMLHINTLRGTPYVDVIGFADGIDTIFFRMNSVIFAVDLKTKEAKEVYNGSAVHSVVPYMGFCAPGASLLCS